MSTRHERVAVARVSVGRRRTGAIGCGNRVQPKPALVEGAVVLPDLEISHRAAARGQRNAELRARLRCSQIDRHRTREVGADRRPELRGAVGVVEREDPHSDQVVSVYDVEFSAQSGWVAYIQYV